MIDAVLAALIFFVPAGIANMIPIPASRLPALKDLNYPLDGGKSWRGKRIFGDHKTVRGLVAGVLGAWLTLFLLRLWYQNSAYIQDIAFINYDSINLALWALVLGLGALGGDAIKSFFKRRMGVPPGATWVPFDQLDYVIGGLLASLLLVQLNLADYFLIALIWFLIHPLATGIGYLLRLKDSPI